MYVAIKPDNDVVEIATEEALLNLKRMNLNQGVRGWKYGPK